MIATTWRKQAACRGLDVEAFYPVTEDDADDAEGEGKEGLSGLAALPHDPPALPLGRAAPDTLTLAVGQCVLEASLADRADGADGLGLGRVGLVLSDGIERLDVEAPAGALLAPRGGDHGKHFL